MEVLLDSSVTAMPSLAAASHDSADDQDQRHGDLASFDSGSEDDAASDHTSNVDTLDGDGDGAPPRKRSKTTRELPAEAIAVFKCWMLSEKNFSHPVSLGA